MGIRAMGNCLYLDDAMSEGVVRAAPCHAGKRKHLDVYLHPTTHRLLQDNGGLPEMYAVVEQRGVGEYQAPSVVVDRELAEDVRAALEFYGPGEGDSDRCVYPSCWQDVVEVRDGFHLCAVHSGQMQEWDALVS